jgi:uncharacterized protein YbaR (Trm112 family)/SAM-dependent methyltransferase
MFYSLLDFLACPSCRHALRLALPVEQPATTVMRTRDRRDRTIAVAEGVLICDGCGRWYPVRKGLPEILPDHLRDWDADRAWLSAHRRAVPGGQALEIGGPAAGANAADEGAHYKRAEMAIMQRPLPEGFFGWALVAPFNASSPMFSFDLLARYMTTASRLACGVNGVVFDLGVGTGWTTEWLVRLGYQAIGLDLCKDYVLAGMPRRGEYLGHYIIADTENIPLRASSVDAVLSFDAFHHVPDRPRAMSELSRIMRPGATMAITEPGIEHEHAAVSIDVMRQHGILEKGFDQAGLEGYLQGLPLGGVARFTSDTHPHDIYTLRKDGAYETDSRAPRALVAAIEPDPPPASLAAGRAPGLTVTIRNTGDTVWLSKTEDENGEVHLGAQLFDASHTLLKQDYARVLLPHDVRPGDAVRLRCELPSILKPGDYIIELDMIDTGFLWFKDYAYQPTAWPMTVSGRAQAAGDALTGPAPMRIQPESLPVPPPSVPIVTPVPPAPPVSLLRRVLRRAKRAYRRASV